MLYGAYVAYRLGKLLEKKEEELHSGASTQNPYLRNLYELLIKFHEHTGIAYAVVPCLSPPLCTLTLLDLQRADRLDAGGSAALPCPRAAGGYVRLACNRSAARHLRHHGSHLRPEGKY